MSPSILQIVVLGIVQGATELLPVSSSAHVIAAERLMRLDPSSPEMTFLLIMLHAGTMTAMIAYFWESWKRSFFASAAQLRGALVRVGLATTATLCIGVPLILAVERFVLGGRPGADVELLFSNLPLVAASLAAAGALILVAGLRSRAPEEPPRPSASAGSSVPIGPAIWIGAVHGAHRTVPGAFTVRVDDIDGDAAGSPEARLRGIQLRARGRDHSAPDRPRAAQVLQGPGGGARDRRCRGSRDAGAPRDGLQLRRRAPRASLAFGLAGKGPLALFRDLLFRGGRRDLRARADGVLGHGRPPHARDIDRRRARPGGG